MVAPVAVVARLADFVRIRCAESKERLKSFITDNRLIAKRENKMREMAFPSYPFGGGSYGAEHAAMSNKILDAILRGKLQAIQFAGDHLIVAGADNCDLADGDVTPLIEQVAEDRCVSPRQQQFWAAHARRTARGEDSDAEVSPIS